MRQVLERFVLGQHVRLRNDLKELGTMRNDAAMRGYWEFRSQGRMVETRLFGFFALPGAFVATDFQPRDIFVTQQDWDGQRQKCAGSWGNLTGGADFLVDPWPVHTRREFETYLERDND